MKLKYNKIEWHVEWDLEERLSSVMLYFGEEKDSKKEK